MDFQKVHKFDFQNPSSISFSLMNLKLEEQVVLMIFLIRIIFEALILQNDTQILTLHVKVSES